MGSRQTHDALGVFQCVDAGHDVTSLPPDSLHFTLIIVFSFLIGLEVKTYRQQFHPKEEKDYFGSARTMTFLGVLGFVLYHIDSVHLVGYALGFIGFTLLYALFYHEKLKANKSSILLYLVSLLIYSFGAVADHYPLWMLALLFVLSVFILNAKRMIGHISENINTEEFETLGKMILLSGVILPLLPNENVISYIPLSPFKIWLAVVVISAISYGGYITQKYLFPSKGLFLTGLIGGSYSSTAATVVLAKKAREFESNPMVTSAIVVATAMMYVRLLVIAFVFNQQIAKEILIPFVSFALIGFVVAIFYHQLGNKINKSINTQDKNPLELGTAFVFAGLFVIMIVATHYVTQHYGAGGLKMFSFVAGFTDVDPFILSLLTGKYTVAQQELFSSFMIAAGSNNVLKAFYALWFGGWAKTWHAFVWLIVFGAATITIGVY